jgi:peptidoglycan/LPS O-acetylase OafA/YrhL
MTVLQSPVVSAVSTKPAATQRWGVLDGWRAISILSVLATHLLPLGPKRFELNGMTGPLGMVLFFNLSGFLITSTLLKHPDWRSFLVRRSCRILPLAVVVIICALAWQRQDVAHYVAHLLFFVNYRPVYLTLLTSPLWSLCVEIHFYLFVAILVAIAGRRGLWFLPAICVVLTLIRVWDGAYIALATHLRADEILAGAAIAMFTAAPQLSTFKTYVARVPLLIYVIFVLACCHPSSGPLNYLRPYAGGLLVARSLWGRSWCTDFLCSRILRYIADISYALYVIHPIMRLSILDSQNSWIRYFVKRPVGFVIVLALSHVSTFYYEKKWILLGKRWTERIESSANRSPLTREEVLTP